MNMTIIIVMGVCHSNSISKRKKMISKLDQLEAEMAKEEINLPDAIKEEVFQVPVAKEDIKKEEDALGDFLA